MLNRPPEDEANNISSRVARMPDMSAGIGCFSAFQQWTYLFAFMAVCTFVYIHFRIEEAFFIQ